MAFLTQSKAKLCKIFNITLVFKKNANFFAENWQKSEKIVVITSTPDVYEKIALYPKIIPIILGKIMKPDLVVFDAIFFLPA
jgi:hypothetical protein